MTKTICIELLGVISDQLELEKHILEKSSFNSILTNSTLTPIKIASARHLYLMSTMILFGIIIRNTKGFCKYNLITAKGQSIDLYLSKVSSLLISLNRSNKTVSI